MTTPDARFTLLPPPADALCLDFANTRYWRGSTPPTETLGAPEDLLAWMEGAGLPAAAARTRWQEAPGEAAAALRQAIELRETIYRVLAAPTPAQPAPEDLAGLNAGLAEAPLRRHLQPRGDGFCWRVGDWTPSVPGLLAPVLWSAADLLAGPRRGRVRICANPKCGWLFLDDSKTGNRRWCSMAACGNRAKAHRHYARRRGQAVQG